jgi:hypothetical protein
VGVVTFPSSPPPSTTFQFPFQSFVFFTLIINPHLCVNTSRTWMQCSSSLHHRPKRPYVTYIIMCKNIMPWIANTYVHL